MFRINPKKQVLIQILKQNPDYVNRTQNMKIKRSSKNELQRNLSLEIPDKGRP